MPAFTTTRKKDAVREDFGHLPPEQRKKALQKKLLELDEEVKKDQKAPMIVTLHGLGGTHTTMMRPNAIDLAEAGGYILLAPMGYNPRGWFGAPAPQGRRGAPPANAAPNAAAPNAAAPAPVFAVCKAVKFVGSVAAASIARRNGSADAVPSFA